jgi:hypothetical protein
MCHPVAYETRIINGQEVRVTIVESQLRAMERRQWLNDHIELPQSLRNIQAAKRAPAAGWHKGKSGAYDVMQMHSNINRCGFCGDEALPYTAGVVKHELYGYVHGECGL